MEGATNGTHFQVTQPQHVFDRSQEGWCFGRTDALNARQTEARRLRQTKGSEWRRRVFPTSSCSLTRKPDMALTGPTGTHWYRPEKTLYGVYQEVIGHLLPPLNQQAHSKYQQIKLQYFRLIRTAVLQTISVLRYYISVLQYPISVLQYYISILQCPTPYLCMLWYRPRALGPPGLLM